MHASPNTGINASRQIASVEFYEICKNSKDTIERTRYLITEESAGLYLATLDDGQPVWVKDPALALQHCHLDTVLHNLYILREFFNVPHTLGTKEVVFYAYTSNPTRWLTDEQ